METIRVQISEKTTKGGKTLLSWIEKHMDQLNAKKFVFAFRILTSEEVNLIKKDGVKLPVCIVGNQKKMGSPDIINLLKTLINRSGFRASSSEENIEDWQMKNIVRTKESDDDDDDEDSPKKRDALLQQRMTMALKERKLDKNGKRVDNITMPTTTATAPSQSHATHTSSSEPASAAPKSGDDALIMNMLETTTPP